MPQSNQEPSQAQSPPDPSQYDIYAIRRLERAAKAKTVPAGVRALLAFSDLDDDALEEALELLSQ